jgi:hypothetical protein
LQAADRRGIIDEPSRSDRGLDAIRELIAADELSLEKIGVARLVVVEVIFVVVVEDKLASDEA